MASAAMTVNRQSARSVAACVGVASGMTNNFIREGVVDILAGNHVATVVVDREHRVPYSVLEVNFGSAHTGLARRPNTVARVIILTVQFILFFFMVLLLKSINR